MGEGGEGDRAGSPRGPVAVGAVVGRRRWCWRPGAAEVGHRAGPGHGRVPHRVFGQPPGRLLSQHRRVDDRASPAPAAPLRRPAGTARGPRTLGCNQRRSGSEGRWRRFYADGRPPWSSCTTSPLPSSWASRTSSCSLCSTPRASSRHGVAGWALPSEEDCSRSPTGASASCCSEPQITQAPSSPSSTSPSHPNSAEGAYRKSVLPPSRFPRFRCCRCGVVDGDSDLMSRRLVIRSVSVARRCASNHFNLGRRKVFHCSQCKTWEGRDEGAARKVLLLYLMEKDLLAAAGRVEDGGAADGGAPPSSGPEHINHIIAMESTPSSGVQHPGFGGQRVGHGQPSLLVSR